MQIFKVVALISVILTGSSIAWQVPDDYYPAPPPVQSNQNSQTEPEFKYAFPARGLRRASIHFGSGIAGTTIQHRQDLPEPSEEKCLDPEVWPTHGLIKFRVDAYILEVEITCLDNRHCEQRNHGIRCILDENM